MVQDNSPVKNTYQGPNGIAVVKLLKIQLKLVQIAHENTVRCTIGSDHIFIWYRYS